MSSRYDNTLPVDSVNSSQGVSIGIDTASTQNPSSEVSEISRVDPRDYYDDVDVFCVLGEEFACELQDILDSGRGGKTGLTASHLERFEDFYRSALYGVGHPLGSCPGNTGDTFDGCVDDTLLSILTSSVAPQRSALLRSLVDYGHCLFEAADAESLRPYHDIWSSATFKKRYSDCTPKSIDRNHLLWGHAIDAFTTDRQLKARLARRVQLTEEMESALSKELVYGPGYLAALDQITAMPAGMEETSALAALTAWASTLEQAKKETKESLTDGTTVKDRFARANSAVHTLNEHSESVTFWVEAASRAARPARG